jgi:hypothetical protein
MLLRIKFMLFVIAIALACNLFIDAAVYLFRR